MPAAGAMVMVSSDKDEEVRKVAPAGAAEGFEYFKVDLNHGPNVITIKVTAADAVSMHDIHCDGHPERGERLLVAFAEFERHYAGAGVRGWHD